MIDLNLPNKITLLRIFLIPLLLVFLISPSLWSCLLAAIVFGFAAATDWLDGHLARVTNQVTLLGKL
ncbi:MAG: CDP-alcohol phosphatidyltransferase family protein, partial [Nitrospinae bacterium]|nr:CDP-alcohol phosphatidyltransferase family protein [Nitrospinota bacterium]